MRAGPAPVVVTAGEAQAVEPITVQGQHVAQFAREVGRAPPVVRVRRPSGGCRGGARTEEACEAATDHVSKIVQGMIAIPALTLDRLRAKARAFLWCRAQDVSELGTADSTDVMVQDSIVRDLLLPGSTPA